MGFVGEVVGEVVVVSGREEGGGREKGRFVRSWRGVERDGEGRVGVLVDSRAETMAARVCCCCCCLTIDSENEERTNFGQAHGQQPLGTHNNSPEPFPTHSHSHH